MLTIRLAPTGKKGRIQYRISVVEGKSKLTGDPVEVLGFYNPHEKLLKCDQTRLKYWVSKGAVVSPKIKALCLTS